MVQSIRDQQLEVVLLLNEIAQQQRDSDLALKSVRASTFEIEGHTTVEPRHRFVRIVPRSPPQCSEGSSLPPFKE